MTPATRMGVEELNLEAMRPDNNGGRVEARAAILEEIPITSPWTF